MRVIPALVSLAALSLLAATNSTDSVFVVTFERPVGDISKARNEVERLASIPRPKDAYLSIETKVTGPNQITVWYSEARGGCASHPQVDGAAAAVQGVQKSLEAEYGPIHVEQWSWANGAKPKDAPVDMRLPPGLR